MAASEKNKMFHSYKEKIFLTSFRRPISNSKYLQKKNLELMILLVDNLGRSCDKSSEKEKISLIIVLVTLHIKSSLLLK